MQENITDSKDKDKGTRVILYATVLYYFYTFLSSGIFSLRTFESVSDIDFWSSNCEVWGLILWVWSRVDRVGTVKVGTVSEEEEKVPEELAGHVNE